MVFAGCIKRWEWEIIRYRAPNWTSDGRIVFMRDHYILKWEDWAKGEHYTEMFIMKRDGTGFKNLGEGSWPDLSPDGKKIVYQKPNQGLWIKNIDGTGDRQIVVDERAQQPAWSPNGERIAHIRSDSLGIWLVDTIGNYVWSWKGDSIVKPGGPGGVDWPPDSNRIIAECGKISPEYEDGFIVIYIDPLRYFLTSLKACVYRWPPDGKHFKAQDAEGNFIAAFSENFGVDFDSKRIVLSRIPKALIPVFLMILCCH